MLRERMTLKTVSLLTLLKELTLTPGKSENTQNKKTLTQLLSYMLKSNMKQLGDFNPSITESIIIKGRKISLENCVIVLRPSQGENALDGGITANIFNKEASHRGGHHAIMPSLIQIHLKPTAVQKGFFFKKNQVVAQITKIKSNPNKIMRYGLDGTASITEHDLYETFIKAELGKSKENSGIYHLESKKAIDDKEPINQKTIMPRIKGEDGVTYVNSLIDRLADAKAYKKFIYHFLQRMVELSLKGLVHGDIKLDNIMICEIGGQLNCTLIDFDTLSNVGTPIPSMIGTPGYTHSSFYEKPHSKRKASLTWDHFATLLTIALIEPRIGNEIELLLEKHRVTLGKIAQKNGLIDRQDYQRLPDIPDYIDAQKKFEQDIIDYLKAKVKAKAKSYVLIKALLAGFQNPNQTTLLDVFVRLWDDKNLRRYIRNNFCEPRYHQDRYDFPTISTRIFDLVTDLKTNDMGLNDKINVLDDEIKIALPLEIRKRIVRLQLLNQPIESYYENAPPIEEEADLLPQLNAETLLKQVATVISDSSTLFELYILFQYIDLLCELEAKWAKNPVFASLKMNVYAIIESQDAFDIGHLTQILVNKCLTTRSLFIQECFDKTMVQSEKMEQGNMGFFLPEEKTLSDPEGDKTSQDSLSSIPAINP